MSQSQGKQLSVKDFIAILNGYRPSWWIISTAVLLVIVETALALAIPLLTMYMIDLMLESNFNMTIVVLLGTVFLMQIILSSISLYMMIYIGQTIVANLRKGLWEKVIHLPVSFFDKKAPGDTMSRITYDTNVIKGFFTDQLIPLFSGIFSIVGSLILLFAIDWSITLILLLIIPLSIALIRPLGRKMYGLSKALQDETAFFQGNLGRVIADIRLVKSSVAERQETLRGKSQINELFMYGLKTGRIMAIISPLIMSIMLVVLIIVFGYGSIQVATGALSAGALVAIVFYMFQIIDPVSQMAQFFTEFQKARGASERIKEIMDEDSELLLTSEDIPLSRESGLSFFEVCFSYTGKKDDLKNVTFTAHKGEMTAVVGPSGAGKSTLFTLIERFYTPNSGAITYSHESIHTYDLSEWRKRIAYVSQDSPMIAGTIRHNLTYGLDTKVSDVMIDLAVEQANLTSFISSLPDKYETGVGEKGIRLSGGQRQRLAIARSIIRDPEILLLDEATAHLDSTSEHLVKEALNKLMKDRTTIVIAHRLSTVMHANRLVVLQEGRVTGEGTHHELYSNHSFYKKLVRQQMLVENKKSAN